MNRGRHVFNRDVGPGRTNPRTRGQKKLSLFSRWWSAFSRAVPPPEVPPAAPPALRGWRRRSFWFGLAGVLWCTALVGMLATQPRGPSTPPDNRPIVTRTSGYVTSDTCRSCHPGNYASWHASFHRTMTQEAKPGNFAAKMDGLELSLDGVDYRVDRVGDTHQIRTKPAGSPSHAYGPGKDIVLLTGSHHLQVCWTETEQGRTLGQFPFAYLIAEKMWAPMSHSFLVSPDIKQVYADGSWNHGCIICHATHGRSRPVTETTFDSRVEEFGISCEACHGPARDHIEAHRNPLRRLAHRISGGPDPTIANPARMDGPTSSLVCGQCHSIQSFIESEDTRRFDQEGTLFRPGMKQLDPTRAVTRPPRGEAIKAPTTAPAHAAGDSFWPDGMIRVTGREYNGVEASPCFKGGKFSCLSCHEMHPERADAATLQDWKTARQMKPGLGESDAACLQCHGSLRQNLTAHTHHAASSSGSRCYNCHMPHTTYGLLRALRSHEISSPNVKETLDHGRPNACTLCHLDQPLAWTADKLSDWYGHPKPKLSEDDRTLSYGAQWLLRGDAGQRILLAWSMGWAPAQKASGSEWMYPFLIFSLNDNYAAVRFAAWKSLQTLPGFSGHAFNYTLGDREQKEAVDQAYQKWWHEVRSPRVPYRAQTLLRGDGMFRQDLLDRMLDQRSTRRLLLAE